MGNDKTEQVGKICPGCWDTQPRGALSWCHMGEKRACGQVSSWQAAALCECALVSKHHTATGIGRKE